MNRVAAGLSTKAADFLATVRKELQIADLESLPSVADVPAGEAERVLIEDPAHLTPAEVSALAEGFHSRFGMVAFECLRTEVPDGHPLARIGAQLREAIPCRWPLKNLSEGADGTTKISDVRSGGEQSRSLTNLAMAAHQDGWLSLRNVPAVTGLWADSVPVERAATFAANIVRLAIDLWRTDEEAFTRLFAEDAVKIVDRAGDTVATSAVLFVDKGRTHAFFREPNDEYDVVAGVADEPTGRAISFLRAHVSFRSGGSVFTYLDRPGRGLLLNNHHCVHGRTAFVDGATTQRRRVVASKWWICDHEYRDVVWA